MHSMEVIDALIIVGHVVGLTLVILWIGLEMPLEQFQDNCTRSSNFPVDATNREQRPWSASKWA